MAANCARCKQPGAGSSFKGSVYHMTCKIELKRELGLIGETPVASSRKPSNRRKSSKGKRS